MCGLVALECPIAELSVCDVIVGGTDVRLSVTSLLVPQVKVSDDVCSGVNISLVVFNVGRYDVACADADEKIDVPTELVVSSTFLPH